MQKIQRKKEKQIPARLIIIASVVFLLLCAGAILLLNRKSEPVRPKKAEHNLLLYQKDLSLLSSIALYRNGDRQLTLLYRNGSLMLEDQPEYPLKETAVESLLSLAQSLTADEFVTELPSDAEMILAPYGLDPPERSAVFRYTDGTEIRLSVGSLMPIENPRYYALVEGQSALYSVTQDVRDTVSRTTENLHPLTRPQISSKLLDRIAVTGDVDFDAFLTPLGWQMLKPFSYPLSGPAIEKLLSQLDNLRFAGWIGETDKLNLSELGLAPPKRTLTVTFSETLVTAPDENGQEVSFRLPSNQMSVALGNTRNDTSFYLLFEDQVYTGTVMSFSFLQNFAWDKYLQAEPVSVPLQALSQIILEENGQKTVFDISYSERVKSNNTLETDEDGNILYDMNVACEDTAIDADMFARWYLSLSGLRGTQRTEERTLTDADTLLYSLTLISDEYSFERTVTVCPYSSVQDILFVDGVSLYLMDSAWRNSIEKTPSVQSNTVLS